MNLTAIALRRPVTVVMFFVCVSVIGLVGGQRLPLESLPDIEFPGLFVQLPYRNSTPEEVERRITRPVEEALATLSGVKQIRSDSGDNGAQIFLQFDWGSDLGTKGVEARDKIDALRAQLPADLERVLIQKFNASDQPMLVLRISSAGVDLANAYDMLNRNLKRRVERIEGVSRVELYGVEAKQVRVDLSADAVAAHGVDLRALAQTLAGANFALSAGDVVQSGTRYFIKPEGRFDSLEDVGAFVVNDAGLRLRDIAEIVYADPVLTYGRHLNRRYAVGLNVFKETGANLVEVSDRVKAEIDQVRALPEMQGISLVLFNDSASDVKTSLKDLVEAGLIGAVFSVIVLWLFMRDLKMTLIVALSVPLSLLMTLAAMFFLGFSINVLTLMGLMLSVGMLIDNSVVVTESIFKERAENPDATAATLDGVRKVGLAVTLGTLTTSIVFLPNIFGQQNDITVFLSHVAVTICCSLVASLLVAITLIPQLTTRLATNGTYGRQWMNRLAARYVRLLEWTLHHPGKMVLFILAILASAAIPMSQTKTDMFPAGDGTRLFMDYNLNGVYRLEKVEAAVNTIEAWLYENQDALEMESVYSYYDLERAQTLVYLKDPKQFERSKSGEQIMEEIRKGMPKIAIGEPSFERGRGSGGEKLGVTVYGETHEGLQDVAADVARVLKTVGGIADVRVEQGPENWEVRVQVDRERARQRGLSSQQVAEVVAGAMRGTPLKPYRTRQGEIEMILQFRRADRLDLDTLMSLPIITPAGERVTLGTVAQLSQAEVPSMIKRKDRRISVTVSFSAKQDVTAKDAREAVKQTLAGLQFPSGYGWAFGEAFEQEDEEMKVMMINMLLALACIYIVMAALFESVLAPTAIVTGILFSFIGVWWFFFLTGTTFSFMATIGMLVLMGIVVNNGIVLIERAHQLRDAGLSSERALIEASRDRLRPILMTAASTVLAMVPLALGSTTIGGDGPPYYPMARAVIGGLTFATVISLIVLPTLYLWIEALGFWGARQWRRAIRAPLTPAPTAEGAVK
jgi:hydrophobic/amphiphilic exporter-1 (mainly G- bacteria), HAE1 family